MEKQLVQTQAENRRLQEPLQKAREEVAELLKQLASYKRDKVSLTVSVEYFEVDTVEPLYKDTPEIRIQDTISGRSCIEKCTNYP